MSIKKNSLKLKIQFMRELGFDRLKAYPLGEWYFDPQKYNDWLYDTAVFNEAKKRFLKLTKEQQNKLIKLIK